MNDDRCVEDVMTKRVVTVDITQSQSEARRVLTEGGFHHVPVVQDGRLVGILSSLDLLRVGTGVSAVPLQSGGHTLTIAALMRRDPVTVRPDTPLQGAIAHLDAHGVHGLPVVDAEGALLGLLTTLDVVRALAHAARPPR